MRVAGNTGVTLGRSSSTFQHVVCDGASVRSANLLDNTVCVADNLFVGGTAQITGTVTAVGAATFKAAVSVEGAAKFNSTVTVSGAANLKSTVTIEGAGVHKSTARFEGQVSVASAVHQTITTLTDATSLVMNMATNNQFAVTLGGNRTLAAPTNLTVGQTGHIYVIQDGTGGRTLSFNAAFQFIGGVSAVMTSAAGSVDMLVFSVRASDKVDTVVLNNLS